MIGLHRIVCVLVVAAALSVGACSTPADPTIGGASPQSVNEVLAIWPGTPPGPPPPPLPETQARQSQGWRDITVVKNVAIPTLTVVRPPANEANGAAMVILPGGAFAALAWDLEGTEVAEFLAQRGITTFVLKYRVRDGTPDMMKRYMESPTFETLLELQQANRADAAADAKQAVRYLREHAAAYGLDPAKIGMMGFSAGAMTTMRVLHEADDAERPDLAAPIYGAMIEQGAPAKAPPIFVAVASDDKTTRASMSVDIFAAWREAGAPVEMHVFETGDHGFGLGRPGTSSIAWPALFEAWLMAHGFIASN